ncbi:MAG: exodeoxyribonuclease VII small subunit [Planctomycetota bacterium]
MTEGAEQPEQTAAVGPASFEQSLQKLEDIVQRLEEGNLPLDESLRLYEEGIGAFRRCQELLEEADLKVRRLVETVEGQLKEEPFEPPEQ